MKHQNLAKTFVSATSALLLLCGVAPAALAQKSIWTTINESAPRSVFDDIRDSAPASPVDTLGDSAP